MIYRKIDDDISEIKGKNKKEKKKKSEKNQINVSKKLNN